MKFLDNLKAEDIESPLKLDNERIKNRIGRISDDIEGKYKNFLLLRYGHVPGPDQLVEFYKSRKITARRIWGFNENYFVVREKGHKIFVMKMWDEYDSEHHRFDFCCKVEKAVFPRKKTTR